jgi:hypothetical protein
MNKQPLKPSSPSPEQEFRPVVPNLPSTTGNKSGGGRGNRLPAKPK